MASRQDRQVASSKPKTENGRPEEQQNACALSSANRNKKKKKRSAACTIAFVEKSLQLQTHKRRFERTVTGRLSGLVTSYVEKLAAFHSSIKK